MAEMMEARRQFLAFDEPGLVTAEKIVSAVKRIVELANPVRVIAFGSRARGDHRMDSDLDPAVIVERYDPTTDQRPVGRENLDAWMSIDLLVFDLARHEFTKDSIISVHHDIANEGVVLYDARAGSIDYGAVGRIAG